MFNTVGVKFIGQSESNNKVYAYLTDLQDIEVGDIVVVDSIHGYKTATVENLSCNESDAVKWIVCKVEIEVFIEKLEELKRKQFILKQMKQRLERVSVIDQFTEAAKHDDTMKALLEAFNSKPTKEITE